MNKDIFPDSRLRVAKTMMVGCVPYVQLFCANCGRSGVIVPHETTTHAFYICDPCAETHGTATLGMVTPDEVLWAKFNQAIIEEYGGPISEAAIAEQLKDGNSTASKLARERSTRRVG